MFAVSGTIKGTAGVVYYYYTLQRRPPRPPPRSRGIRASQTHSRGNGRNVKSLFDKERLFNFILVGMNYARRETFLRRVNFFPRPPITIRLIRQHNSDEFPDRRTTIRYTSYIRIRIYTRVV